MAVSGADVVAYARQQLGKPYEWGAEGPSRFDCSGLVQYVYRHFGIGTPRTTYQQVGGSGMSAVDRKQAQAGDLIFSNWGEGANSHVGIYTGNGSIIEAPEPGKTVTETKMGDGYWSHVTAIRRVQGTEGGSGTSLVGAVVAGAQAALGATQPGVATVLGFIPNPKTMTDAVGNIGAGMASVAQSALQVGELAGLATKLFLPTNLVRAGALLFGTAFIIIGIWFLAREIKASTI